MFDQLDEVDFGEFRVSRRHDHVELHPDTGRAKNAIQSDRARAHGKRFD
ncbi:hypothetical protein [Streptomyces spiralis]